MQSGRERSGPKTGTSAPRPSTSKSATRSAAKTSTSSPSSRGGKRRRLCPMCNRGTLHRGTVKEEMFGFDLGTYPAEICDGCGEHFIDLENFKRTEARAKKLGLWGLAKKVSIAKSGNSLVVRIPAALGRGPG